MAHFSTRVPAGRSLFFAFYATGHSHFGQPSAAYVAGLMQTAEHLPRVDGILVYTTKATPAHHRECAGLYAMAQADDGHLPVGCPTLACRR